MVRRNAARATTIEILEAHPCFAVPGFKNILSHRHQYENEIADEDDGHDVHQPFDVAALAGEEFDDGVGDETECEAVGDGVRHGNADQNQKCRNAFGEIIPVDVADVADHHRSHNDQRGRGDGRVAADHGDDGAEKQREKEQHGHGYGRQAGAAALLDARRALDETHDRTRAERGAGDGADGVGHERAMRTGKFVVLDEARPFGHADESAQRVEKDHEEKDEDERDHGRAERAAQIHLEKRGGERLRPIDDFVR